MAEKIFFGGYIYENEIEKGAAIILVTDGRYIYNIYYLYIYIF